MKRLKHNFKKGMAFVLSLAMVAGLVPAMSGGANKVQAATGTGTEPSVSAYATKEQLMTAFTPNSKGNATTIGKLVFGKNSSGASQEWYILGKDGGVSGDDNTIIFAASPIATDQMFSLSTSNKTYNYEAGTGYGDSEGSKEVYLNHYGASELREVLKSMATNISYFTTAEQNLMNATTVTTNDTKNSVTYTTTDKLYALQGDYYNDKLCAGTSDSTVLDKSSYWSNGFRFWLRSPYDSSIGYVLVALPDTRQVDEQSVGHEYAVQPASNLNLKDVLFASAAKAPSSGTVEAGSIAEGTAMTLRLNGSNKKIGAVVYNDTTGEITAQNATGAAGPVSLVIQGKNDGNDWFYSVKVDGKTVVTTDQIKTACNISDLSLANCKIWLETTIDNVTYAKEATQTNGSPAVTKIASVAVTGVDTPVANSNFDTEALCSTTGIAKTSITF